MFTFMALSSVLYKIYQNIKITASRIANGVLYAACFGAVWVAENIIVNE